MSETLRLFDPSPWGGECWEWPRLNSEGYGRVRWFGKWRYTHRVIAAMTYGADAIANMQVMHLCDNRSCYRPSHLRPGTGQENMLHCWARRKAAVARLRATAYQEVTHD